MKTNFSKQKYRIFSLLRPEWRTSGINMLAYHAPDWLKRCTEKLADIPIQSVVRRSKAPLFIHIPKNAGTTVVAQLYGRHVGHRSAAWYRAADCKWFEQQTTFAFSRNPVSRFRSAFEFLRANGTQEVRVSRRAHDIVSSFNSVLSFAEHYSKLPLSKIESIDPTFHSQTRYINDAAGKRIVDQIFRIEDVAGTRFNVCENLTIDMTERRNQSTLSNKFALKDSEVLALEPYLHEIYRRDYQELGYT